MTAPFKTPLAGQDYPYWPFNWLSAYGQVARDFGRYAQALTQCTDAMEAARAEADFGLRLFDDLVQAYWALAAAPLTALASATAQAPGAAELRPVRSGRSRGSARD